MSRRRYARLLLLAGFLGLAACDHAPWAKPDVEACEAYIKDSLKAPSTYKRIAVYRSDEPISLTNYKRRFGTPTAAVRKIALEQDAERGLSLRQISVEYDAANAFGTLMRGAETCRFRLVGGKLPSSAELKGDVAISQGRRTLRQLNESGLVDQLPDPIAGANGTGTESRSCCIN